MKFFPVLSDNLSPLPYFELLFIFFVFYVPYRRFVASTNSFQRFLSSEFSIIDDSSILI